MQWIRYSNPHVIAQIYDPLSSLEQYHQFDFSVVLISL